MRTPLTVLLSAVTILSSFRAVAADPTHAVALVPATEAALAGEGLVNAQSVVPELLVRLKYAVAENFMGEAVYGADRACYLQRMAAEKLARAQEVLSRRNPGYRLLVGDCLRPRRVQRRMWKLVHGTPMQNYVARPDPGSMHNHGAAVDISIADENGEALDMGTPFDHFGPLAQPRFEDRYLRAGALTREQVENRRLLREVMTEAGWRGIRNEWWHFEAFPIREIRQRFPLIEAWPDQEPRAPKS